MTRHPVYLGMVIFLVAESVFFFMLILAFVFFHGLNGSSPHLSLPLASISTGCLLGSSFAIFRAQTHQRESSSGSRIWMGVTILLGLLFLLAEGREYRRLLREGVTISQSLFGTTFFTLTGIHALHVLAGVVLLTIISALMMGDEFAERRQVAVHAAAMYWYFLSAAGVAIFLVVYLRRFL